VKPRWQTVTKVIQSGKVAVTKGWCQGRQRGWSYLRQTSQHLRKTYFSQGRRVSPLALQHMRQSLLEESSLAWHYLVLIVGSCIIATFGLLANSTAVIIGAMLIAPLMLPIRGAAFGMLEADKELIQTSLTSLAVGTGLAVVISMLLGWLTGMTSYGSEVFARSQPNLLDLGIAITAGGLAGFAKVSDKLSSSIAGTAIAVALMPPVCVVGLWMAQGSFQLSQGALLLYLTNLFGITLACMVVFMLAGYSPFHQARRPIGATLMFTALLVLPLGASTLQLLRQDQLEASLKTALLDRTVTFQRMDLITMNVNWLTTPPEATLVVHALDPVSPKQVQLLENFVATEMGRPFRLIFQVNQIDEVTSDPEPEREPDRSDL
jgi:uncharacterized hydrophobic protein (TIGR00271 family)